MRTRAPWTDPRVTANGATVSENFKTWFGKSLVVDQESNPLRLFHSTFNEFDAFEKTRDLGFHFGSSFAANKRIVSTSKGRGRLSEKFTGFNLVPVHLKVERPFHLTEDPVCWNVKHLLNAIEDVITEEEKERISLNEERCLILAMNEATEMKKAGIEVVRQTQPWAGGQTFLSLKTSAWTRVLTEHMKSANAELVQCLESHGFDGLTYPNQIEGEGRTRKDRLRNPENLTWVVFRPENVKSAIGNSGLYLKESASLVDGLAEPLTQTIIQVQRARRLAQPAEQQFRCTMNAEFVFQA